MGTRRTRSVPNINTYTFRGSPLRMSHLAPHFSYNSFHRLLHPCLVAKRLVPSGYDDDEDADWCPTGSPFFDQSMAVEAPPSDQEGSCPRKLDLAYDLHFYYTLFYAAGGKARFGCLCALTVLLKTAPHHGQCLRCAVSEAFREIKGNSYHSTAEACGKGLRAHKTLQVLRTSHTQARILSGIAAYNISIIANLLAVKEVSQPHDFLEKTQTASQATTNSSIGGNIDAQTKKGIYVLKLHGQIYHHVPDLLPSPENPRYLQLYIYDGQHEAEHRANCFLKIRQDVIDILMELTILNPYARFFRSLQELDIQEDTQIVLNKSTTKDQRVYNAPTSDKVVVIWTENSTTGETSGPHITVTGKSDESHRIMHYYGCYDPLQYPLLFPTENAAGTRALKKKKPHCTLPTPVDSSSNYIDTFADAKSLLNAESTCALGVRKPDERNISCREYYCYKLQNRPCNMLLRAGRCYQQYVVDMYVKLENTRLDIFRNNQGTIRAELYQGLLDTVEAEANVALRKSVLKHMMHGPCGKLDPECPCMKHKKTLGHCKYGYPKQFTNETTNNSDGYPVYRRRDTGAGAKIRKHMLDNRWVIPYNPYLMTMFNCHLNVEVCSTIQAVKYLYKYVYKGHDKVSFNVTVAGNPEVIDEIEQFQSGRWVSPCEAVWRIFGFDLYEIQPPVMPLQVHLPNMQTIQIRPREDLEEVIANEKRARTPMTEFFKVNAGDTSNNEPRYSYGEFPEHFRWDTKHRTCFKRKTKLRVIGKLVFVAPSEGERYFLRLLLLHVRAPKSFQDLLTVEGCRFATFQEAALKLRFLEHDNTVEMCLDEADVVQMPFSLRRLFAIMLIFCQPKNPPSLWDKYYPCMSEDFHIQHPDNNARVQTLTARAVE
ncbi:hypothetical protein KSS87_018778 [Heliosperma pusillum]|nr:hypothetical protein KSS87_018778 [Heliosperma pusillum]